MKAIAFFILSLIWCPLVTIINLILLMLWNKTAEKVWTNNDLALAWPITKKLISLWQKN